MLMVDENGNDKPRARDKRDRKATEETILAAFEAVLLREGVSGLGVNAVAQEAGVNKVLIYRYFGDFDGLARQWASSSSFWPSALELIGNDEAAFEKLSVHDRVIQVLRNYMIAIRSRPRTVEMLAAELSNVTDTTRALADGMVRPGKDVGDYIKLETADSDLTDKVWKLIFLANTLTAYAAIRERNNPKYLSLDLSQDESWNFISDAITDIATSYLKD